MDTPPPHSCLRLPGIRPLLRWVDRAKAFERMIDAIPAVLVLNAPSC